MLATMMPYAIGIAIGAAGMGGWWFWINHRAKVRALEQAALAVAKKV